MANYLNYAGLQKYDELIKEYIGTVAFTTTDRQNLNTLVALLASDDSDTVVNTITEILNIFSKYPEGADIVDALADKVDKEDGKGLSSNDYTDAEKTKLSGIAAGANKTTVENVLTSTSTTNALSAAQGKELASRIASINANMENLGAGDMLKSVYDVDNNGQVDNADKADYASEAGHADTANTAANATQLGGVAASSYALSANIPTRVSTLTNDSNFTSDSAIAISDIEGLFS